MPHSLPSQSVTPTTLMSSEDRENLSGNSVTKRNNKLENFKLLTEIYEDIKEIELGNELCLMGVDEITIYSRAIK